MRQVNYILIITALLVILFLFTGLEKVWYHAVFRIQLYKQPLPGWSKTILNWGLPLAELAVVGLLAYWRTRRWGLWTSALMLLAFAGYTAYAASEPNGHVVCACGKLFSSLSWMAHFWVNTALTVLAATAAVLHHRLHHQVAKHQDATAPG